MVDNRKERNLPDTTDAEKWRLHQAEELLRERGFVEQADGTWKPSPDLADDEERK